MFCFPGSSLGHVRRGRSRVFESLIRLGVSVQGLREGRREGPKLSVPGFRGSMDSCLSGKAEDLYLNGGCDGVTPKAILFFF